MNSTKIKNILAALMLGALASSASATATVLTFDNLAEATPYGDGSPLLDSMSYDGNNLTYQESGFQLTLNAPNSVPGAALIGTGTYEPQTYNWGGGDGSNNGDGTYVTLTRVRGGSFDLLGFDYVGYGGSSALLVNGQQVGTLGEGPGTWNSTLTGISVLRLNSVAINQLDNISVASVSAVPEPSILALLLGGLATISLVRRRQR